MQRSKYRILGRDSEGLRSHPGHAAVAELLSSKKLLLAPRLAVAIEAAATVAPMRALPCAGTLVLAPHSLFSIRADCARGTDRRRQRCESRGRLFGRGTADRVEPAKLLLTRVTRISQLSIFTGIAPRSRCGRCAPALDACALLAPQAVPLPLIFLLCRPVMALLFCSASCSFPFDFRSLGFSVLLFTGK